MDESRIKKLLESPNKEDKLLGVTLAVSHFGEEWCIANFKREAYRCSNNVLLDCGHFQIWLGHSFIEYYSIINSTLNVSLDGAPPVERAAEGLVIINNKNNGTNK